MTKHFKAKHVESGEEIFFGLEDIFTINDHVSGDGTAKICIGQNYFCDKPNIVTSKWEMDVWLEDYKLYYLHEGEYYEYETNR